jgi:hypothetical protein
MSVIKAKPDDSKQPEQGQVFCGIYTFISERMDTVKQGLDRIPEFFINGETEYGYVYKWISDERGNELCEIILMDEALWVFSAFPGQLARAEQWICERLGDLIHFAGKCRADERRLLNMVVTGQSIAVEPARGILAKLNDMRRFTGEITAKAGFKVSLGKDGHYWFCAGEEGVSEYYGCGDWVRIHVFQGDLPFQLDWMRMLFAYMVYDVDTDKFLADTPRDSQNYWIWRKAIHMANAEAKGFRARGFIPELTRLKDGLLFSRRLAP